MPGFAGKSVAAGGPADAVPRRNFGDGKPLIPPAQYL
jgi:hypothetical protein